MFLCSVAHALVAFIFRLYETIFEEGCARLGSSAMTLFVLPRSSYTRTSSVAHIPKAKRPPDRLYDNRTRLWYEYAYNQSDTGGDVKKLYSSLEHTFAIREIH
jgi:hypothetical protein